MIDDRDRQITKYHEYKQTAVLEQYKDTLKRVKPADWGSEFNKSPKVKKVRLIHKPTPATLEAILKKEEELWNS